MKAKTENEWNAEHERFLARINTIRISTDNILLFKLRAQKNNKTRIFVKHKRKEYLKGFQNKGRGSQPLWSLWLWQL